MFDFKSFTENLGTTLNALTSTMITVPFASALYPLARRRTSELKFWVDNDFPVFIYYGRREYRIGTTHVGWMLRIHVNFEKIVRDFGSTRCVRANNLIKT